MRHPEKCNRCTDKPCKNNPYNEDGECWRPSDGREDVRKAILDDRRESNESRQWVREPLKRC